MTDQQLDFEARLRLTNTTQKVLVVDDEPDLLEMVEQYLIAEGYEVTATTSGAEAIEYANKIDFGVVVTDLKMEPIHGFDVIQAVNSSLPDAEVVIMTAYASIESVIKALQKKVYDYIEKPFDMERIRLTVYNAFAKKKLSRENKLLNEHIYAQSLNLEKRIREVKEQLEKLSFRDALTDLYNYRFFANSLQAELARSIRYNRPLVLLMMDLDYFKQYNDQHGHSAGNDALVKVARILDESSRRTDIVVRYGGEEFAIIMTEADQAEAWLITDRINDALVNLDLPITIDGVKKQITFSIGIASCPDHGGNYDDLIQAADQALYAAKDRGRNLVVVAGKNPAEEVINHEKN